MSSNAGTEALLPLPEPAADGEQLTAEQLPIARVLIDSSLPHLDRLFDYRIPPELHEVAQPGVRVRVRFAGQELAGFLIDRVARAGTEHKLAPLGKVVSPLQVLKPEILALATSVAARYAGAISDVLRVAVPPRAAKVEQGYLGKELGEQEMPPPSFVLDPELFRGYDRAQHFLEHLAAGGSPRATLGALRGYGALSWHHQLAQAIAVCAGSGRGAIAVVPDLRDLDLLCVAVAELLGADSYVRLTADDGPTPRYRGFLRVLSGECRIVLGTRSAAFAPVQNLGLLCCWDDGDDLLIERRAPYQHAREVLLLRAEQQGAAVLLAGHTRSTEAERLLESGWAQPITPQRSLSRRIAPRVVNTSDSFETERDPLATLARLPHRAWQVAQQGLERGPVLIQVARGGYIPALACENCRESARCTKCAGPLGRSGAVGEVQCRWCGTPENSFSCPHCGGRRLRNTVSGAGRTAEELGRAFPKAQVISSANDHVKATIPDKPALVVATVGAEPVAAGGYAAALLLDGDTLMRRENLRAAEEAVRRWFTAAALVQPAEQGGTVVLTASQSEAAAALVRWDPAGFAARELAQRRELGLPPAVRLIALTGALAAVTTFMTRLELPDLANPKVRVIGPALLSSYSAAAAEEEYRSLIFVPYAMAQTVLAQVRAVKASLSASRQTEPVQVRCDGVDLL
ncbi:primosomal protein N' (replication factor Y) [Psychromicrobium silvestre]|uniref:Probable replication restart protein PriA n=1 Tax=Psychromicrobium silvestre TaxID=1645614 RepID=A0A7Y9LRP0_9MICC|nr:primosomal protein N' [Psychromicrobium silvestre]NYE94351.1 primosomal protein N' (replication factor Y) [Psychromicrobium silvestre]